MSQEPPSHIKRAKRLRQEANTPEQTGWSVLCDLRNHGFPVRRQRPAGPYTLDFEIPKARRAIEVYGAIHALQDVRLKDAERQKVTESLGWRVLRFDAEAAMSGVIFERPLSRRWDSEERKSLIPNPFSPWEKGQRKPPPNCSGGGLSV